MARPSGYRGTSCLVHCDPSTMEEGVHVLHGLTLSLSLTLKNFLLTQHTSL